MEIPLGIPFEVSREALVRTEFRSRRFDCSRLCGRCGSAGVWGAAGAMLTVEIEVRVVRAKGLWSLVPDGGSGGRGVFQ